MTRSPSTSTDSTAPCAALAVPVGSATNYHPTDRADLPDNTRELLIALHLEFYGGPKAHADAFRILPRVVNALQKAGAIRYLPNKQVSRGAQPTPDSQHL